MVQYMLFKYKMRELIKRSEMVKVIHRRYKAQYPEILSRASEQMEMVFGMVLKEVRPNSHCYTLVSNLDLSLQVKPWLLFMEHLLWDPLRAFLSDG